MTSKFNIGPKKKEGSLQESVNCKCCVVGIGIDAWATMRLDSPGPVRKPLLPLVEMDKN